MVTSLIVDEDCFYNDLVWDCGFLFLFGRGVGCCGDAGRKEVGEVDKTGSANEWTWSERPPLCRRWVKVLGC